MRRTLKLKTWITRLTATSLLLMAGAAHAQIGGPHNTTQPTDVKKKSAAKAPASFEQRFEKQGIAVDFQVKATPDEKGQSEGLVAGSDATVTFRLTDARTGSPITGLHPNGWINTSRLNHTPNEAECKDQIKVLSGGLLSARADIDLNSYLVLTINHDNTISVINPLVSFSKTKLESLITLPGTGADWALSKKKELLYVTLPEQSMVAVIDTQTRKIVSQVLTGEKTRPTRIQLQPDGRYLWVGLDGKPLIAVIDTKTNKLVSTVAVGEGLHSITFTADSRFAYITNTVSDTVTAVETNTLSKVAELKVAKTPVAVAYSSASGLIYAASVNGETISVINPAKQQVIANIQVGRGVVALRFEPKGRYGFVVNQVESTVSVIDASTNALIGKSSVVKEPDQVVFTGDYAYIRGLGSEKFSLIELRDVPSGNFSTVDVQGGQRPATDVPADIGVADMIAPIPEGNGAMIANAADGMFYYYTEGMMAPMGSFSNYKRRPRGLLILDRSLSEVSPGVNSTPVKLTKAGSFVVPFLLNQPQLANCFQLSVAESPNQESELARTAIQIEPLFKGAQFKAGESVKLRFKITDPATNKPVSKLEDVRVLAFEPPGIWQQRQWAREAGNGIYEIEQVFPHDGIFNIMVEVSSRGTDFSSLPYTAVTVAGNTQTGKPKIANNQ
ncbi:MAG TPA: cytochrome D1 domain-containing protein [Pyrinomonadaceae bacterium]